MTPLAKKFLPSRQRLLHNAHRMMTTAQDPSFRKYWQKVYLHLCRQYNNFQ